MKYLKRFNESKNSIESICIKYGIYNYTINEDGSIDVDVNVDLANKKLIELPLRFRNVGGNFWCHNSDLTTLEGCPENVGGDFTCFNNRLTSLKGCPEIIGGDFACFRNEIVSLDDCPKNVVGDFDCSDNQLTSLEGLPQSVYISCMDNNIVDFRGISEYYEGDLDCEGNPIYEIYALFKTSKCIKWINEFDVIKDGNKVIMDRLEEVYHQLGMEMPENITFKSYEIV